MDDGFVIMQIGNPQLDLLWKEVYCPALKECGLNPKRVDKHEEGRLLNSEIADFIKKGKIIIADLTNERPNCYLEVGYAMGIGKFKNLILCAREDHHFDSPNYVKKGPKIHFDLSGYGFSWWEENRLEEFKRELVLKIKRRISTLENTSSESTEIISNAWEKNARSEAAEILYDQKKSDFYEIVAELPHNVSDKNVNELLNIAEKAKSSLSGWPIGVVLHNERRPVPLKDGIKAIISSEDLFDYWLIKTDGSFYFIRGGENDRPFKGNKPGKYFYLDTIICRITETFIYLSRLYKELGFQDSEMARISLTHGGLKGRVLSVMDPNRLFPDKYECKVNEFHHEMLEEKIGNLVSNLEENVFTMSNELFTMFDFFQINRSVCDDIVNKFITRRQ